MEEKETCYHVPVMLDESVKGLGQVSLCVSLCYFLPFLFLGVGDNRDAAHQEDTESSFLRLVW